MSNTNAISSHPEPAKRAGSPSESGHAKNVANFEELICMLASLGSLYNPSRNAIKLPALYGLLSDAQELMSDLNTRLAAYKTAVDSRELAFEPLNRLSTRILNALKATDTNTLSDESARSIVKKIQGKRISEKLSEEEKEKLAAEGKVVHEISASQLSYDNRLDNFDKLVKLLEIIPQYLPNESDLKLAALNDRYEDLKAKNLAVVDAHTRLSNARIARNEMLYKPISGMVDLSVNIKSYIKSLSGPGNPHFKQVSGLRFANIS